MGLCSQKGNIPKFLFSLQFSFHSKIKYHFIPMTLWFQLRELGHLCSLMPGLVPTSAQLSLVVDLVSGMGLSAQTICNLLLIYC